MNKFELYGKSIELPAVEILEAETKQKNAWKGKYLTVQLTDNITAFRVHTDGRSFGTHREASYREGRWLLIGDIVFTRSELANNRALPISDRHSPLAFTHLTRAVVWRDTILNIGIAGPLFGHDGGEFQAEFVSGPAIEFVTAPGTSDHKAWVDYSGHA
jgi:hypothetical protein